MWLDKRTEERRKKWEEGKERVNRSQQRRKGVSEKTKDGNVKER